MRKAAGLVSDDGVSVGPVPSRLAVGAVTVAIAVGGCGHDAEGIAQLGAGFGIHF